MNCRASCLPLTANNRGTYINKHNAHERYTYIGRRRSYSHNNIRASGSLEATQSRLFDLQVQYHILLFYQQLDTFFLTTNRYDKSLASRQAEVDLITADLDRAQSHIATLEREYESLKNRFKGNSQESR